MKVVMLEDNKTVEVNDGYGLRLIEQGAAVPFVQKEFAPKQAAPKVQEEKTSKKEARK